MYGQHRAAAAERAIAMQRVGDEIRIKREAAGITLRGLARAIGVSAPFMSDVEHGRRSTTRLTEIEVALGLRKGQLWKVAGLCRHCGGSGLAALDALRKEGP